MANTYKGKNLHPLFKRSETIQGVEAPRGVATLVPYTLADAPQSRQALKTLLGTVGGGRGRLVALGVEFDVDLTTRQVTWLATARWPLLVSNFLVFDYWTYGRTA